MPSTRKIAFALGLPLVLAVFILVLAAGIYLFLPHYIESTLLPQLIAETGISDYAINVRRVGFSGADLSDVRIGPQSNPIESDPAYPFDTDRLLAGRTVPPKN
jgi:hypothetical protein